MEVTAVGVVPDAVLLQCGRPASTPTAWWTPTLVGLPAAAVAGAREAAAALMGDLGVRDPATGRLRGPLATVAEVVRSARLVVLVDRGPTGRRSVVAGPDLALLDRHVAGGHDLLLAAPAAAVRLVAALLGATTAGPASPAPEVAALAGRRTPDEVAAALPPRATTVTTVTRTLVGRGVHVVTVVAGARGSVACWQLPGGDVHVQVLDTRGVADLALLLLGAEPAVGPG